MVSNRDAVETAIERYISAWNEEDAVLRRRLLDACWSERGTYVDPAVALRGRDALAAHIAAVRAGRPGARLEFASAIDAHHDVLRFHWRVVRADGTTGDISLDIGEMDADGRIARMIGFFGAPPNRTR